MTISGIVVACQPGDIEALSQVLSDLPWVDVHYTDPRGRLVATIEAEDIDQSMARFKELQGLPRVLSAELAEYCIEDGENEKQE
jgi:nitrate reductase NapAB chaperone NapD